MRGAEATVPRYYFGFFNDVEVRDPIGTVLHDEADAQRHAEQLRDYLERTIGIGNWKVRITDDKGCIVREIYPHDNNRPSTP